MKVEPLYHNVLVRPMRDGDVTESGLLIPEIATANTPFRYGHVVATGAGRINAEGKVVPLAVHEGDVVLFHRKAGVEVPVDTSPTRAEVLLVLEEKFILGIVHELPQKTNIVGVDGRLLSMVPQSRVLTDAASKGAPADSAIKAREDLDRAEKDWKIDTSDHVDEAS